jgi:hypothetical protein
MMMRPDMLPQIQRDPLTRPRSAELGAWLSALGSHLTVAVLAGLMLVVSPASASEIWLVAGVPVVDQEPQWRGIRSDSADLWVPDAPWQTVAH